MSTRVTGTAGTARGREPDPADPVELRRSAMAAMREGRTARAIELLESAVRARPAFARAHNDLGVALGSVDRLEEAAAAFRSATTLDEGFAEAHFNLGSASHALGRLEDAARAYARAVELSPTLEQARIELSRVLRSLGRAEEAVSVLDDTSTEPASATLLVQRGMALERAGRLEDAASAFRLAIARAPDNALAHNNLGCLLRDSGQLLEAVSVLRRAVDLRPDVAEMHINLGVAELARGEPRASLSALDRGLALAPGGTRALALKAVAHRELRDHAAARQLLDFERFVRTHRIRTPAGFSSLAEFNAALARHVLEHPTLVADPDSHATRNGRHSGNLLVEPKGPMKALEDIIGQVVANYVGSLVRVAGHPFVDAVPRQAALQAWGVVLGPGGHQIPHIHPGAWLSGVYYVRVPRLVEEPGPARAGWLEFGRPHPNYPCTVEPDVEAFEPEEGLMVVFPAYFYHHTVPFEDDATRISIAFDVCSEQE